MRKFKNDICQFASATANNFDLKEYNELCHRYLSNWYLGNDEARIKLVNFNAPFSHPAKPGRPTVLLIHGLSESPFSLRDLATKFIAAGYGVQSILLPGHGSSPEDLQEIHRDQWLRAANYACDQLKKQTDKIIIAGISMGAAIALYCAATRDDISGLVLISPALDISKRINYMRLHNLLKSLKIIPNNKIRDYGKYPYNTSKSLKEAMRLIIEIRNLVQHNTPKLPIFGAVSLEDEVILTDAVLEMFQKINSAPHKLICYTEQKLYSKDTSIEYIYSRDLSKKIISYSHTSLHISPANPLYGASSSFVDNRNLFITKKVMAKEPFFGAVHKDNLRYGRLARLRFNPKFDSMMDKCLRFLRDNV